MDSSSRWVDREVREARRLAEREADQSPTDDGVFRELFRRAWRRWKGEA